MMLRHLIYMLCLCVLWVFADFTQNRQLLQKKTDDLLSQLDHFETIIPQLVTHQGHFLSYDVTHSSALRHSNAEQSRAKRWARRKWTDSGGAGDPDLFLDGADQRGQNSVFYKLSANGREFHFNLSLNTQLLTKDFVIEFWNGSGKTQRREDVWHCHYTGNSVDSKALDAAISNCNGLQGVFSTDTDDYFVEPLWNHTNLVTVEGHPHVVYSRSSLRLGDLSSHCGVRDYKRRKYSKYYRKRPGSYNDVLKPKHQPLFWKWRGKTRMPFRRVASSRLRRGRGRVRRSVSLARHVETLVVIDKKMMDYHSFMDKGSNSSSAVALTTHVLTIMNIVRCPSCFTIPPSETPSTSL